MSAKILTHTAYNAAGLIAPIIAALVSIPILIHVLGADRFGILTLVWAIVNYFGIFDLGLGRALTLQMAVLQASDRDKDINELVRTALLALLVLGLFAGLVLLLATPFLVSQINARLDGGEISGAVHAMAFALSSIVVTSGLRGALEAKAAFGVLNAIRVPMSLLNFVLPVLIAIYGSARLDDISWGLALARVVGMVLHGVVAIRLLHGVTASYAIRGSWIKTLFANGGWMTVSNIVSPLMGYLDRFIVGFILPAAFISYYATPQELILKLYLIPGALTAVLFPVFAGERLDARKLYARSLQGVTLLTAPACAVGFLFADSILSLWVSPAFAEQSYQALRILVVGVFCGTMSAIPYTYLQAIGRSNLPAVSHVAQVPLFIAASYFCTLHWGIEGAAFAWSARLALDAIILFALAGVAMKGARD